jgi:hypothetical protein
MVDSYKKIVVMVAYMPAAASGIVIAIAIRAKAISKKSFILKFMVLPFGLWLFRKVSL